MKLDFAIFLGALWLSLSISHPQAAWAQARAKDSVGMGTSLQFRDLPIQTGLKLIASRMKLVLDMDPKIKGRLSYNFENLPIEAILETITQDNKLFYDIEDGRLYVGQLDPNQVGSEGPAVLGVHKVEVQNNTAQELLQKLPKFISPDESLTADDSSNALILYGRESSYKRLVEFVQAMDSFPKQILIQAQIVETSKNFSRDLGLLWGHTTDGDGKPTGATSVNVATAAPSIPNLSVSTLLGLDGGRTLEARLLAAEDKGDAKILSKPRVITMSNKPAVIHSGINFHIKTLSTKDKGESKESESIAGGLQQISAGLDLNVLPVVVGRDMIRLNIGVSNSEPNYSQQVDGIPGITDNSANASIIVQNGRTVTMAGLIKSTLSESQTRVPWLGDIPLIGWLFRSQSNKDINTELMIFITPTIVDPRVAEVSSSGR